MLELNMTEEFTTSVIAIHHVREDDPSAQTAFESGD